MQQQHVDTVRVVVPRAVDSVKVRITGVGDTAVVQVPASVHATFRQVGGGVYAFSNVLLVSRV